MDSWNSSCKADFGSLAANGRFVLGLWLLSARAAAAINLTRRKARAVLVLWGLWLTAALFDALSNGFDGLDKHVAVGFHSLTLPSVPSCRPHLPDLGPPVGSWLQ